MPLYNLLDKEKLREKLMAEDFRRITLSFYRYVQIHYPDDYRDDLYRRFEELGVLGRTYIAHEGINAQISIPEPNFEYFKSMLDRDDFLAGMPLKFAVEDDGKSFIKLIVRVKKKIVADGLEDNAYDVTNVGTHLDAKAFNEAMKDPRTVVLDMRNHYESEVGHFKGALLPAADTFRQAIDMSLEMIRDKENPKILLYCTGGIRCEKASAWFKSKGYEDVNQLHGGIIDYARQIKAEGLESMFIGKNFVFDERMGERISPDVISVCHQCGSPCDTHVNCANEECHLLFIQCEACATKMEKCCTKACADLARLPIEARRQHRKGKQKEDSLSIYRSRLRPRLQDPGF